MRICRIPVEKIEADPDNPRTTFAPDDLAALGKNMATYGQQVPIIIYPVEDKFRLADGERRWRAAQGTAITELLAMVHPKKPDEATLAILQMSLEVHKVSLSPLERSNLLVRIKEQTGLCLSDLGERLQMSQPLISKLLAFQKLGPDARALLHAGQLDMEKAYLIAGESDATKQASLLGEVASLSRDELRSRRRRKSHDQPKSKRAVFVLRGGLSITIQGLAVTLDDTIEWLTELVKELRRGSAQGLDITTQQRVMRDKAKQVEVVS